MQIPLLQHAAAPTQEFGLFLGLHTLGHDWQASCFEYLQQSRRNRVAPSWMANIMALTDYP
jgi:hypothetical protein